MSQTEPFDAALDALLRADRAPPLPAGFADRVVAAAETRAPALPALRRASAGRWRTARRTVLGAGLFVVLSSAAAATGVLQQVGITLPQPVQHLVDDVAQRVTGQPVVVAAAAAPPPPAADPAPVMVEGPIDSPEELDAVFARADAHRPQRVARHRALVDQRIDQELERRRAAGLPVPSAEQEAAMRQRLADVRARRDAQGEARRDAVRSELREAVEQGQPLTREAIRQAREDAGLAPVPRLSPDRRATLRQRLAERRGLTADPAPEATASEPMAENLP